MYAYIKGNLIEKSNGYVIIETGGIGYKIFMSISSIEKMGEINTIVKVYTHYHVREDNISLYGFLTNEELKMFELILSVSGIGAKTAIAMLAKITPSNFALAVITGDVSGLKKIPGIGAKTAQRIILELKDKLKTQMAVMEEEESFESTIVQEDNFEEAVAALQMLGYNKKEIDMAMQEIPLKDLKVEEIIKRALAKLSK